MSYSKEVIPVIENVMPLAAYIKHECLDLKKNTISPLKLQKSLYFLFAYWGGFIRKSKQIQQTVPAKCNNNEESSYYSDYSEYLYYSKIEAWMYDPCTSYCL
ncbi:hypothetical protein AGMMS49532_00560 [Endomicrobiia bacterium]|uniref:hypothetical protein n=1 Tax=Endomicrobium trichonymphae TaxID=1408204 RepID=UPI000BAA748A|nr:hypothetical protein [Candidatus Endomicrobium trichonymphae]GHT07557.1 hypothetical protein AGMMS49532_00560 [Endomicrobiia bacterium]